MDVEDKSRRMYQLISSQLARDGYLDAAKYVATSTQTSLLPHDPQQATLLELLNFATEKSMHGCSSSLSSSSSKFQQYTVENFLALGSQLSTEKKSQFEEVSTFSHKSLILNLAQSSDGELFASSTENGDICVHTRQDHTRSTLSKPSSKVTPFRYYDDDVAVIAMSFHPTQAFLIAGCDDGSLKTFSYDQEDTSGHSGSVTDSSSITSLDVHPSGAHVLYTTKRGQLRFFEFDTNQIMTSKIIDTYNDIRVVQDVQIHPFGNSFAYIQNSNTIVVHDGASTKEAFRVENAEAEGSINHIEYSKSGNVIISSSSDGTISLWDLRKFCTAIKHLPTGLGNSDIPMTAKFLWKEDVVVCNCDSVLKGFDVHSGGSVFTLQQPCSIGSFLTSPVRESILTAGSDLQLRFFEAI